MIYKVHNLQLDSKIQRTPNQWRSLVPEYLVIVEKGLQVDPVGMSLSKYRCLIAVMVKFDSEGLLQL